MNQEESIYNLIEKPREKVIKPAMYRSKFPGELPPSASTFGASRSSQVFVTNVAGSLDGPSVAHQFKNAAANFGPLRVQKQHPNMFMKKGFGHPPLKKPTKFEYADKSRKTFVPKRTEKPVMGLVTTKNFISANVVANILKEPENLVQSPTNEMPRHAEYGKVPEYLQHVKNEIQEEYNYIREMHREENIQVSEQSKIKLLQDKEKQELLIALKMKWQDVNKIYQTRTHEVVLDTVGKLRRKEAYEADLQQIEKDIEKLSKQYVFLRENPE
uniref:Enkurin n=1 Tax=Hirondellea gigas TaxID=1518452 RepID=A0A6A7G7C6_9CRUS